MNAETALTSPLETATSDAAYFVLNSVWSYLNWMTPLEPGDLKAQEIVSDLKRSFLLPCSAAVHILSNSYTDKWRELHMETLDTL